MASAHAEADALSKVPDEGEAGLYSVRNPEERVGNRKWATYRRNKCDEREKAPFHGEGGGDANYDEAEDD